MPKALANFDLAGNQLLNALLQLLAVDPGAPAEGRVWYDTANHVLKYRNNAATVILGRLDQISAPTNPVSFNAQRITGVADPTGAQDAATKNYVDATILGLDFKGSVRLATAAALPANNYAGGVLTATANGALTVDGVVVVAGDRILVKNEATGSHNGVYVVTQVGTGALPYILTRATDFDSSADASPGALIPIEEGTANADTLWLHTTNAPVTLDTSALTFSRLGPALSGPTKFSQTIGDNATTSFAVNHNLGSQDVLVACYQVSDGAVVIPDVTYTNANTVTVSFAVAPTNNQYRVVVIG